MRIASMEKVVSRIEKFYTEKGQVPPDHAGAVMMDFNEEIASKKQGKKEPVQKVEPKPKVAKKVAKK